MRKILLRTGFVIGLLLCCISARSQFYQTGDNPARARWRSLRSDHYTVIYPRETDSLARRYLFLLERDREAVLAGLQIRPRRLPVVLNPYTTQSNGVVVWAPKRMELYTLPPANDTYAQHWEQQLVLHESRHVGQVSYFTGGIYKPLGWLIGQQAPGIGVGVYPAGWLLEGDAVVAETELSQSGRGRSASFLAYYRASFLNGEYRTWDRWRYGSYKYYTPDIYAFGYLINSTIRYRTGKYAFEGELLDYFVRKFYNPNVTNAGYRSIAGATASDYLKEGQRMMTSLWREELPERGPFTEAEVLQADKSGYYTDYARMVAAGEDSLLAVKTGYGRAAELVLLYRTPGPENGAGGWKERVLRPFASSAGMLRYAGGRLFWTETVPGIRWGKETYNDLFSYELKSGRTTRLSRGQSYNNPVPSPDGKSVAVIEYPVSGGSRLVLLAADSGRRLKTFPAPEQGQLLDGAYAGGTFYAAAVTGAGEGLFRLSPDGTWSRELKEQHRNIRSLGGSEEWLYFAADFNGVDNAYRYDPFRKRLEALTNDRYGVRVPSVSADGSYLYYARLGLNGTQPVRLALPKCVPAGSTAGMPEDVPGEPERDSERTEHPVRSGGSGTVFGKYEVRVEEGEIRCGYRYAVADELSRQARVFLREKEIGFPSPADSGEFRAFADTLPSRRYRKGLHLFRFHSWAPVYYNVDNIMKMSADHLYELVGAGAAAYSQNTLGTAVAMLGYSYRKGFHAGHFRFRYSGLMPVLELRADYNEKERYNFRLVRQNGGYAVRSEREKNPLLTLELLAYVPLNFSSRGWQRGLVPQVRWKYDNTMYYSYERGKFGAIQELRCGIRYYQMRPTAKAEVFPRWGFGAEVQLSSPLGGGENFGPTGVLYGYGYLPGIAARQGFRWSVSYQKQWVGEKVYYRGNIADLPRGYEDRASRKFWKVTADYAVPLYLGDVSLGWFAYLQRLKVIPFADYGVGFDTRGRQKLWSAGADLMLDTYLFHIGVPLSIGIRYARTGEGRNYTGFLFSTSLF